MSILKTLQFLNILLLPCFAVVYATEPAPKKIENIVKWHSQENFSGHVLIAKENRIIFDKKSVKQII